MSALTANDTRGPSTVADYAKELLAAIRDGVSRHLAYHRQLAELRRLDDHQLTDLGIGRRDFDAIARGTYGRG